MSTSLPGLLSNVKQMDSVSRFYARQGFLGMLLTKVIPLLYSRVQLYPLDLISIVQVTNQIVLACKEYIQESTTSTLGDEDLLWKKVQAEITGEKNEAGDSKDAQPAGATRANTRTTVRLHISPCCNHRYYSK